MTDLATKAEMESEQPDVRKDARPRSDHSLAARTTEDRAKVNEAGERPALPIRQRNTQPDVLAAPPVRTSPTAIAAARRTEQIAAATRPAVREGNSVERKQEGPRLSIGRLEIQIIQESVPTVSAGQYTVRESFPEDWEQIDRQYIRHLSMS